MVFQRKAAMDNSEAATELATLIGIEISKIITGQADPTDLGDSYFRDDFVAKKSIPEELVPPVGTVPKKE